MSRKTARETPEGSGKKDFDDLAISRFKESQKMWLFWKNR